MALCPMTLLTTRVMRAHHCAFSVLCHDQHHVTLHTHDAMSRVQYVTDVTAARGEDAKPFDAMPGPLRLPIIGTMYKLPYALRQKNSNEVMAKYNKLYGPIVREQFGPRAKDAMVSVYDIEALETIHRHDGKYPRRIIMEAWQNWRDESEYARGVLIEDGPDWKRMRVLLDKQMLRPRHVSTYGENFAEVSRDFIKRLRKLRGVDTKVVQNMNLELFHWSLESIGTVLYETRFGGLSESREPEIEEFIQAVHDMFVTTPYIFYLPRKLNKIVIPKWQNMHDDAWSVIFKQGKKQIDRKCIEIERQLAAGHEVTGFLSKLIASGNMSMDEIYGNISELMTAAVDTTSNAMQWVIYELSKRRHVQETLRDEVLSVIPRGTTPTSEQVQNMPYLKGFIKEILRLYPVANVDTRITNDDLVLCGYHVPKDTRILGAMYVIGRNPQYFSDPLELKPERWIRAAGNKNLHTFAWLPFGYGTRMCIGRRVAELEIYILTSMLLQEFDIRAVEDEVNPPVTRPLVVPDRPVLVQLIDR